MNGYNETTSLESIADAIGRIIGYVTHCHHSDTNMLRMIEKCKVI